MKIPEEIAVEFNQKADELRKKTWKHLGEISARTDLTDDQKNTMRDILTEDMNRMEVARRVFNCFAVSGEVVSPD